MTRQGLCRCLRALVVFFAWAIWAACNYFYCREFLSPSPHPNPEPFPVTVLACANLAILLAVVLDRHRSGGKSQVVERVNATTAAFVLGVTPLGLAVLGLAASVGSVQETILYEPPEVSLARCQPELPEHRLFLLVDVSKSVLKRGSAFAEETEKALAAAVQSQFPELPIPPKSTPKVVTEVWVFAESAYMENLSGPLGSIPPSALPGAIKERLDGVALSADSFSNRTDLVFALERISSSMVDHLNSGTRVSLVVVSDFVQDPFHHRDLDRLMSFAKALPRTLGSPEQGSSVTCEKARPLTIIGLVPSLSSSAKPSSKERRHDLREFFKDHFVGSFFEGDLSYFAGRAEPVRRQEIAGVLAAELRVDVEQTMYLKYETDKVNREPIWTTVSGILPDYRSEPSRPRELALKLRVLPGSALPSSLELLFKADGDPEERLVQSSRELGGWETVSIAEAKSGRLRFAVRSPIDVSRSARFELLIGDTERAVVYAINGVVLPTLGKKADSLFRLLVSFFLGCVLILTIARLYASLTCGYAHQICTCAAPTIRRVFAGAQPRAARFASRVRRSTVKAVEPVWPWLCDSKSPPETTGEPRTPGTNSELVAPSGHKRESVAQPAPLTAQTMPSPDERT